MASRNTIVSPSGHGALADTHRRSIRWRRPLGRKTARSYLDLLCSTFAVRHLRPRHENLKKRQVTSPKVYLADSGLLHSLLGISTLNELHGDPKVGASWEGFVPDQVIARLATTSIAGRQKLKLRIGK